MLAWKPGWYWFRLSRVFTGVAGWPRLCLASSAAFFKPAAREQREPSPHARCAKRSPPGLPSRAQGSASGRYWAQPGPCSSKA